MDKKKVLIGMSGGVDSGVSAYLLKKSGYDCYGAIMSLKPPCCDEASFLDDVESAKSICKMLDIPFQIINFKNIFKERVIDNFIDEYKSGRTPNPCVQCNKYLKFGEFLNEAQRQGMDYVATGHYAKVVFNEDSNKFELHKSLADKKDQSYVLYNLTQDQLSKTIFPLFGYQKEEIRRIAHEIGIKAADRPDSQEICFIKDKSYSEFIIENDNYLPKKGNFIDKNRNIIGEHKGIIYYTIGQRKGLGAFGRPMIVLDIDCDNNTVMLGEKGDEYFCSLTATDLNFISGDFPTKPFKASAKTRYLAKPTDCYVYPINEHEIRVDFVNPERAISRGQSVVLYDKNMVLGGGIISNCSIIDKN